MLSAQESEGGVFCFGHGWKAQMLRFLPWSLSQKAQLSPRLVYRKTRTLSIMLIRFPTKFMTGSGFLPIARDEGEKGGLWFLSTEVAAPLLFVLPPEGGAILPRIITRPTGLV